MGFLDKLKGKVGDAADSGKLDSAVDKTVDAVDNKTGGKLGDKKDVIADKAKDTLGGLGDQGNRGNG